MKAPLSRFDPFRDFAELEDGVNQMIDQMRHAAATPSGENPRQANWAPPCDVCENENEIIVIAEIPGVKMDDINLEVTSEGLSIEGERQAPDSSESRWVRVERSYGRFSRAFSIGIPIDVQSVKAVYRDGLLTVTIPKSEAIKPKRISVEAG